MVWEFEKEVEAIKKSLGDISFQDQRVLITGGAGFLGSWMSDVLVSQEAEVICVDNLASGLKSNVDHLLHLDNFSFIEHDITEPFFVEGKLDLVVHMASRASPFEFEHYPLEILKANTIGLMNSLECAKINQARLLYFWKRQCHRSSRLLRRVQEMWGGLCHCL